MSKQRRIIITHIHPADAHYSNRRQYIGLTGFFEPISPHCYKGYYYGEFYSDNPHTGYLLFKAVRYRKI